MLIDEGLLNENVYVSIRYVIMHEQESCNSFKRTYLFVAFLTNIVSTFIIQMNNLKSFLVYGFRLNCVSMNVLQISIWNVLRNVEENFST